MSYDPEDHVCERGRRWALHDARGIFCCYVCDACEADKRARYRAEVLTDAGYEADEAIEEDA